MKLRQINALINKHLRPPSASATYYAIGYVIAKNGSPEQASRQACIYDGVSQSWWRLVHKRLLRALAEEKLNG